MYESKNKKMQGIIILMLPMPPITSSPLVSSKAHQVQIILTPSSYRPGQRKRQKEGAACIQVPPKDPFAPPRC